MYDDTNLVNDQINTYANSNPPAWGLDISERLFWEAYIMMQDCSRPSGTEWDIGRGSEVRQPCILSIIIFFFISIHRLLLLPAQRLTSWK